MEDSHDHHFMTLDALDHLLHAEEELCPEPCTLPLIPGTGVAQAGLHFRTDNHRPAHD